MNRQKLPSFWLILWISLVLCLIGWGGLAGLVYMTLPTLGPRWLFFFLLTLGLSGLALPMTYFLNRRFPSETPVDGNIVTREAMWVGVYGSLLAWLQMGRVLTPGLIVVLALGLFAVEFLLRYSERSQWSPSQPVGEADAEEADEADDYEDEDD